METIPFSYAYAYAYVTPGLHGLSCAYVYACAYAYVVRVNQAIVFMSEFNLFIPIGAALNQGFEDCASLV